jgi:hypothetical protein
MKNNVLEYIILYTLVISAALIIATLTRMSAISLGVDSFTAFIIFIVVLGIEAVVYLSIHVILQELMLPWIGKGLSKIPYFYKKKIPTFNLLNTDEIRKNNTDEKGEKLNIAIHYTQKTFAPYANDDDIANLCDNIGLYVNKSNITNPKPIRINNQLTSLDIYHFGWNIWNHFKIGKQDDIASLLKSLFPHTLRDAETETIKKHLKDDERKGIIIIQENITV